MFKDKKIICVIPARRESARFPRKIFHKIHGKILLQWVWEAAKNVELFDDITFAIDSEEVAEVIKRFGGNYQMTSINCKSGTDRVIEVMKSGKVKSDIFVNWQGDEPFINEMMIQELIQSCDKDDASIWALKKKITFERELNSPAFSKVVCDVNGKALYFSRSVIPFYRDKDKLSFENKNFYKSLGLYAFTTQALEKISSLNSSYLEDYEKLEQLRWIYHGLQIKVHETEQEVVGIDFPEDIERAEKFSIQLQT